MPLSRVQAIGKHLCVGRAHRLEHDGLGEALAPAYQTQSTTKKMGGELRREVRPAHAGVCVCVCGHSSFAPACGFESVPVIENDVSKQTTRGPPRERGNRASRRRFGRPAESAHPSRE